jgi:hypothetical protein
MEGKNETNVGSVMKYLCLIECTSLFVNGLERFTNKPLFKTLVRPGVLPRIGGSAHTHGVKNEKGCCFLVRLFPPRTWATARSQ